MGRFCGFLKRLCTGAIVACVVAFGTGAAHAACTSDQIDVNGDGSQCEDVKFQYTSTGYGDGVILTAIGTFYIDWGDTATDIQWNCGVGDCGPHVITITKTDTTSESYTHSYYHTGHTIRIAGTATGYGDGAAIKFYYPDTVYNLSGSLGELFPQYGTNSGEYPRFTETFKGSTRVSSVPATLFSGLTGGPGMFKNTFYGATGLSSIASGVFDDITNVGEETFYGTFRGCTNLSSIPSGLFGGLSNSGAPSLFQETFYGCTKLTSIPTGLFDDVTVSASNMFNSTFYGCTKLASIPDGLFSNLTTGASKMFYSTFQGCTSLTSIPNGLFTNISTAASELFRRTFYGCTNLSGFIPPSTFKGLVENGSPTAFYMWDNAFYNTALDTTCPSGTAQYVTGYEGSSYDGIKWDGKVSCGCELGYWGDGVTCAACTNTPPANSSFIVTSDSSTCSWKCDEGYIKSNGACVACGANEFVADNICQTNKFSVTTTSDATSAIFTLSAKGTFYVNCGDGGFLTGSGASGNTITRTDTTSADYTCSWASAGAHTIKFGGVADTVSPYNTSESVATIAFYRSTYPRTHDKIASVSGSLGLLFPQRGNSNGEFPRFYYTFGNCSNLSSISSTLFSGLDGGSSMFYSTFSGCTSLGSISATLFSDVDDGAASMFVSTFSGCTGLTSIPDGLFSNISTAAASLFSNTFSGCTGLNSIPSTLFSNVTGGADSMFSSTFNGCTGLTSIPDGLFSGINTAATYLFSYTFSGCSNITGFIKPNTFAGLIANNSPAANRMWLSTFNGTQLVTSCPSGTQQYITKYEGSDTSSYQKWNGKVACGCENGYWGDGVTCTACNNSIPEHNVYSGVSTTSTCSYACDAEYYRSEGTCIAVGDGYYSPAGDDNRYWCDNKPSNTVYTGSATTNNCPYACAGGYYLDNDTCVAVGVGYYSPAGDNSRYTCTNKPTNSTYSSSTAGSSECPWSCDSGYMQIDSQCVEVKFTAVTNTDRTIISLSAIGTFYIDWGDGKTETIVRDNTTPSSYYSNSYSSGSIWGSKTRTRTIRIGGTATGYNTNSSTATIYFSYSNYSNGVTSISGSLGALFPQYGTDSGEYPVFFSFFNGMCKITSIPEGLFSGLTGGGGMFYSMFRGCTNLTSIPDNLFSGITNSSAIMFHNTFDSCTSLTSIPDDLFSGITTGADMLFYETFYGCTGLTSIPDGLFSRITTGAADMFNYTFYGCTGLTSIPDGLFSSITTAADRMFDSTFNGCTNLTGFIPPNTFAGLVANGSPTSSNMWDNTFNNTQVLTSCPSGTAQYITGYEGTTNGSTWNGRVSCGCETGYWGDGTTCAACTNTKPADSTFLASVTSTCPWACDAGYTEYNNTCYEACSVSSTLHAGTYSYPLFADKTNVSSPVLHIKKNDTICYAYLEADETGNEHGLKVRYNDTVYHAIDPR